MKLKSFQKVSALMLPPIMTWSWCLIMLCLLSRRMTIVTIDKYKKNNISPLTPLQNYFYKKRNSQYDYLLLVISIRFWQFSSEHLNEYLKWVNHTIKKNDNGLLTRLYRDLIWSVVAERSETSLAVPINTRNESLFSHKSFSNKI